mmetsp:Transcript_85949/g.152273  ORF Transcript_85949/g.152273 Transcript_85949/m.152273 type:complete len:219 (-) Transcript_85949:240-896(-)
MNLRRSTMLGVGLQSIWLQVSKDGVPAEWRLSGILTILRVERLQRSLSIRWSSTTLLCCAVILPKRFARPEATRHLVWLCVPDVRNSGKPPSSTNTWTGWPCEHIQCEAWEIHTIPPSRTWFLPLLSGKTRALRSPSSLSRQRCLVDREHLYTLLEIAMRLFVDHGKSWQPAVITWLLVAISEEILLWMQALGRHGGSPESTRLVARQNILSTTATAA